MNKKMKKEVLDKLMNGSECLGIKRTTWNKETKL